MAAAASLQNTNMNAKKRGRRPTDNMLVIALAPLFEGITSGLFDGMACSSFERSFAEGML